MAFVNLIDMIYPVGSIYQTTSSINPQTLFGGGWSQIKDRFLVGSGSSYATTATGGESKHTLTADEMPSHNHPYIENQRYCWNASGVANAITWGEWNGSATTGMTTGYKGGGASHNNLPPYYAVAIWRRVS